MRGMMKREHLKRVIHEDLRIHEYNLLLQKGNGEEGSQLNEEGMSTDRMTSHMTTMIENVIETLLAMEILYEIEDNGFGNHLQNDLEPQQGSPVQEEENRSSRNENDHFENKNQNLLCLNEQTSVELYLRYMFMNFAYNILRPKTITTELPQQKHRPPAKKRTKSGRPARYVNNPLLQNFSSHASDGAHDFRWQILENLSSFQKQTTRNDDLKDDSFVLFEGVGLVIHILEVLLEKQKLSKRSREISRLGFASSWQQQNNVVRGGGRRSEEEEPKVLSDYSMTAGDIAEALCAKHVVGCKTKKKDFCEWREKLENSISKCINKCIEKEGLVSIFKRYHNLETGWTYLTNVRETKDGLLRVLHVQTIKELIHLKFGLNSRRIFGMVLEQHMGDKYISELALIAPKRTIGGANTGYNNQINNGTLTGNQKFSARHNNNAGAGNTVSVGGTIRDSHSSNVSGNNKNRSSTPNSGNVASSSSRRSNKKQAHQQSHQHLGGNNVNGIHGNVHHPNIPSSGIVPSSSSVSHQSSVSTSTSSSSSSSASIHYFWKVDWNLAKDSFLQLTCESLLRGYICRETVKEMVCDSFRNDMVDVIDAQVMQTLQSFILFTEC
eukprot:g2124.t1